jgi:hypothetical protein
MLKTTRQEWFFLSITYNKDIFLRSHQKEILI